MNFWPFNIAAKRRAAEQAERDRKAERNRDYRALLHQTPAAPRPAPISRTASPARQDDSMDMTNLMNPLNPFSPVSVFNHSAHNESHGSSCDTGSSHSSSSSYESSSSSYDSGSSCDSSSSSSSD